MALSARTQEPTRDLGAAKGTPRHVRIARRARVERKGQVHPGLESRRVRVAVEKSAPGQRTDLGPAEALEQRHPALTMSLSRGLSAHEDQPRGMVRMARGVRQRDGPAERGPVHDRARDPERIAERVHVVAPLGQGPTLRRAGLATPVAAMIEEDDLRNVGDR